MSGNKDNLIVGLDIGTTKICAIVGHLTHDGIDIVGIGKVPSKGLRKGVVINIEATVEAVRQALQEAELMAGCEIKSVFAGIAGGHIKGFNSQGVIAIKNREVTNEDLQRVIDAAKAIAIPMDREVIHILPQEFIIDDQDGIKEPLGMNGVRLEAKVHIVTGAVASAQNIIKSCNRAGVDVADIVLEQLASSEAVLTQDEKDLGVVLLDIGGGTTDIAIYSEGAIKHTAVLSLGGNHLTNDIAVGLRTPTGDAEKIKQDYGCCLTSMVGKDESIEVPTVGGRETRQLSRQLLKHDIGDIDAGAVAALDDVLGARHRAGDDMHLGLQADPAHPQRLLDAVLVVDDELLGENVNDLPVHGDGDRLGRVDDPADVVVVHLAVLDGDHPLRVEPLDVPPGDTGEDRLDLAAGHQLRLLQRLFDGADGALDVDHHPLAQPLGRTGADPHDVEPLFGEVADDGADLGRTDIEPDDQVFPLIAHRSPFPP